MTKPNLFNEVCKRPYEGCVSIAHTGIQALTGSGEIHVSHIEDAGEPAAAPGPGHNYWVNEAGHAEGEHSIGGTLDTLRHTSAHDGGAYIQKRMHAGQSRARWIRTVTSRYKDMTTTQVGASCAEGLTGKKKILSRVNYSPVTKIKQQQKGYH